MSAPSTAAPPTLPPLQNGDRMDAAEFRRRRELVPDLRHAELIEGVVYIGSEHRGGRTDPRIPPLENGDHLSYDEFERRWDNAPDLTKAELIDGVVYMAPPVSAGSHGLPHSDLGFWLGFYRVQTPGTDHAVDSTVRLDAANAPQPDCTLFVPRSHGGSTWLDAQGYIRGVPELVAEVSASSVSYDLHQKLHAYERAGIAEYVVHRVADRAVDWFVLAAGRYQSLAPDGDGILRSRALPGLWLDAPALARRDMTRVMCVIQAGIASAEHAAFVERLARAVAP